MSIPKDVLNVASKNKSAYDTLIQALTAEGNPAMSGGGGAFQTIGTSGAQPIGPATGAAVAAGSKSKDLLSLLSKGKIGSAFKSSPGVMGIGSALILGMLLKKITGFGLENQQENITREGIQQQLDADPEDMYYQAMMPDLMQQRQQAQNAFIQSIAGGRGQKIQVPGERQI